MTGSSREEMIDKIIQCQIANGHVVTGDLFLAMDFRTYKELVKICQELNIKVK